MKSEPESAVPKRRLPYSDEAAQVTLTYHVGGWCTQPQVIFAVE
jgi:hypothetical protein